ncbi:hypothetical protein [Spectribacter hydrogenoxidans]|uniref:Bacteriophage holin family HP1 n=1 Tax=Spectribacter hydrogenoxidans TaxID=3075608 RepID=A0ABU3C0W9_9GAMM|nr:hypothetical protein [Salinisphaera sp. W335]MDT0635029.1 hypothetical protein [Salinisphaera sp. W335]
MTGKSLSIVTAMTALGFAPAASAYLDPGTGSMIISAIVGLFASLVLAIKTYWYRLVGFFRRLRGRAPAESSESRADDDGDR